MPPPDAAADTSGPGPPEEIKAVPVRHPGRWIAAAIVAILVAAIDPLGRDEPPLRVERRRRLPVRLPDPQRDRGHARADRARDG